MMEPSHRARARLPAVALHAAGGFLTDSEAPAPVLKKILASRYEHPFRRIDRFIQLALIGAGRCAGPNALTPQSGLYMTTGYAATSNMYALLDTCYRQGVAPTPFNYVNSVANAAGFHIARSLGIHGRNISMSGEATPSTVMRTFQLAALDLWQGHVDWALVGFVHESHEWHACVPEGSHWFLLGRSGPGTRASVEFLSGDHPPSPDWEAPPPDLASSEYFFAYPQWLAEWLETEKKAPRWLCHEACDGRGLLFRWV